MKLKIYNNASKSISCSCYWLRRSKLLIIRNVLHATINTIPDIFINKDSNLFSEFVYDNPVSLCIKTDSMSLAVLVDVCLEHKMWAVSRAWVGVAGFSCVGVLVTALLAPMHGCVVWSIGVEGWLGENVVFWLVGKVGWEVWGRWVTVGVGVGCGHRRQQGHHLSHLGLEVNNILVPLKYHIYNMQVGLQLMIEQAGGTNTRTK